MHSSISAKQAGQELKEIAGKSVKSHCPTRFSIKFFIAERLLQLKEYLPQILHAHRIDNLTIDQWSLLDECRNLLKPFADYTEMLAKETEPTISLVIPSIHTRVFPIR